MSYAQPSPPTIQTLFFTSVVGDGEELLLVRAVELVHAHRQLHAAQADFEQLDALALLEDLDLVLLRAVDDLVAEVVAEDRREALEDLDGVLALLVERKAEAEAEFGVVFEERVCPGRAAAVGVLRPRRRRQIAAEDRGTAGGVRDDGAVAEELRHQLQVRRLAAAGAGAGELEERLLRVVDGG